MNQTIRYKNRDVVIIDDLKWWKELYDRFLVDQEFYEDELLNYIGSLELSGVYVDVGANVGNHTLFWALFCNAQRILAFEALPRFCAVMTKLLIANRVLHKVDLFPFGLSDEQAYVDIEFFDSITPSLVRKLDDIQIDTPISLVKIDVEGMEPKVLKGGVNLLERDKPLLFVEAHAKDNLEAIMEVIEPIGYQLTGNVFNVTPTYEISAD